MSQSTNKRIKKAKNIGSKRKMKTKTKIIIFLVVFTIIAVSITVGAIFYTNSHLRNSSPLENSNIPIEITDDGFGIKTLTEQYDENDLKINEIIDSKGTRSLTDELDTNTNKLTINYIQIDGLKNSSIETNINDEIKKLVYSLFSDNEINDPKIDYIIINARCSSNFGNVLSIDVLKSISYKDKSIDTCNEQHSLNYNLNTGDKLKFTDLFTNSSIKNVLTQAIYDNVINKYIYNNYNEDQIDMAQINLGNVENETYEILNKIMANIDTIDFYFTPDFIFCFIDNKNICEINISKVYKNISIYKRFKTTFTIFDGSYYGQENIFVCTKRASFDSIYTNYKDIYDNLRVEVIINMFDNTITDNNELKKFCNSVISQIEQEISEIKNIAKTNPNKGFVFTSECCVYTNQDKELSALGINNLMANFGKNNNTYSMPKEYYTSTLYPKISEFYRKDDAYVKYVFNYTDDDSNIKKETAQLNSEPIDLYTNQTKNILLGKYYIDKAIQELKNLEDNLETEVRSGTLELKLANIQNSIGNYKQTYKLTDLDIKDAINLISSIRVNSTAIKIEEPEVLDEPEVEVPENNSITNKLSNTSLNNNI